MKLVLLFGNAAVGKMTVGQELRKITGLRLFHNHMAIEPVLEVFGEFQISVIAKLRHVIFEEFAKTDNYGLIFTFMWPFELQSSWEYVERVKDLFRPYGTEFYYVELVAPRDIRLNRNATEKRLLNKPSKRNIEESNKRLVNDDDNHRFESIEGEIPFENYIKIDNSNLAPETVAQMIKNRFGL